MILTPHQQRQLKKDYKNFLKVLDREFNRMFIQTGSIDVDLLRLRSLKVYFNAPSLKLTKEQLDFLFRGK